jgi:serine/threonine-protein kinase
MNGTGEAAATGSVSPEAVADQVRRITGSGLFSNSGALKRFLRHIVDRALAGQFRSLSERWIGTDVFGRGESFDPRVDPIVRVQARNLRARLHEYYARLAGDDPIEITLPKGSYVPTFRPRRPTLLPTPPPGSCRAIAVLPFVDLSPRRDHEYLAHGLTDELISVLSRIEGLRVAARSSSFRFKEENRKLPLIRRLLRVNAMLEGSIRVAGKRLRVTAHLVDAANGFQIWSETIEKEMKDLLKVQEEISRMIVSHLLDALAGGEMGWPLRPHPENLDAYYSFLKGRFFLYQRSFEALNTAIEHLRNAIAGAPDYAQAYCGLADCYAILASYGMSPSTALEESKAAATKALQSDPLLPDAHTSLALVSAVREWDWGAAEQEFRRSVAMNPREGMTHALFSAYCLGPKSRLDEALKEMELGRDLDPLCLTINMGVGVARMWRREYPEAVHELCRVIELDPNHARAYTHLGRTYAAQGAYNEALDCFEQYRRVSGSCLGVLAEIACCQARLGNRDGARQMLGQLKQRAATAYVSPVDIARTHAALEESAECADWMERARRSRDSWLVFLAVDPVFDSMRSLPQFPGLLREVGLEQQPLNGKTT